jgi:hypothetical protein
MKNRSYKIILIFAAFLLVFPIGVAKAAEIDITDIEAVNLGEQIIQIDWITSIETRGKVLYGAQVDNLTSYIGVSNLPNKYHSIKIGNLKPETTYYYQIVIDDFAGAPVKSFVKKIKVSKYNSLTAPVISNAHVTYVTGTAAVVEWETNELASANIEYDSGKTYKSKASAGGATSLKHFVVLKKLKTNTKYYLRLYSTDKDKNKSSYVYKEFTTNFNDTVDKEDLIISRQRPSGPSDSQISSGNITVSFHTNHSAKGKITLKRKGGKTQTKDLNYSQEHSATFFDLLPGTEYVLDISMTDIFNKKSKDNLALATRMTNLAGVDGLAVARPVSVGGEVIVLGAEFSFYTPACAIYKTTSSARIYSILGGKRFYITSPASFKDYGYSAQEIKAISQARLMEYPRARLIKSPEKSDIYYLYERAGKIMKIKIPSPAVFNSYSDNSWDDVVKVSQIDINNYPSVKLVKVIGGVQVYYLEGNTKCYVSEASFINNKFNRDDIMEISQKHFDSYQTESPM